MLVLNIELEMVWVSWHPPSKFDSRKTHCQQSSPSQRHTSHRWFLARELSIIACDMHGKNLLSKRFATHEGSKLIDFLLDLTRLSFGSPGSPLLLACQAPPKNRYAWCKLEKKHWALLHVPSQKPSLGAPKKWSLERLWNGKKCLRCCAEEKQAGAEVYQSTFHQNHIFFFRSDGCYVWVKTVKWSHTWVLQPLVCRMRGNHLGFTVQEQVKEKWLAFNCSSILVWICGNRKKCWTVHSGVAWISDIGWA